MQACEIASYSKVKQQEEVMMEIVAGSPVIVLGGDSHLKVWRSPGVPVIIHIHLQGRLVPDKGEEMILSMLQGIGTQ